MDYSESILNSLQSALEGRSLLMLLFAFLGGVLSSLLPCTVGMLPVMIGYVGGYSELSKWQMLRQILLFILGLSLVLAVLGVVAALAGIAFGGLVGEGWFYLVGVVAVVMGLQLLEFIHLPLPQTMTRLPETKAGQWLAPLLLGIAFGAASSPCGTPFLTAILGFVSNQKDIVFGGVALLVYGLGQSVLLLVIGLFTGLLKQMATIRKIGRAINQLSGWVFIFAGLVLIAKTAGWLDFLAFY